MNKRPRVLEVLPSKRYYTNSCIKEYLLGWVLLINGQPVYNGTKPEIKSYLKMIRKDTDIVWMK